MADHTEAVAAEAAPTRVEAAVVAGAMAGLGAQRTRHLGSSRQGAVDTGTRGQE